MTDPKQIDVGKVELMKDPFQTCADSCSQSKATHMSFQKPASMSRGFFSRKCQAPANNQSPYIVHLERIQNDCTDERVEDLGDQPDQLPITFDRNVALARLGGLEDLLQEVLQTIRVESPKMHQKLERALEQQDAVELKRAAHTLKGSASIVGASDLVYRLQCVEGLADATEFGGVRLELPEISRQFHELMNHVEQELLPKQ